MSEVTNTAIPAQWNNNAAYSVNDQGVIEQKGFFGRLWSGLQSLTASGRRSIAHENQKVLIALFANTDEASEIGYDHLSFGNLADPSVRSGSRAIKGGDIIEIREKFQAQLADHTKALGLKRISDAIKSEIPGLASGETDIAADAPHILAALMKKTPADRNLSAGEANDIGSAIANSLAGNGGVVNQELVGQYLREMDSDDFQNMYMAFERGFIDGRDAGASTKELKSARENGIKIFSSIRSHLEAMRTSDASGITGGSRAAVASAAVASAAAASADAASADGVPAGTDAVDSRIEYVRSLLFNRNSGLLTSMGLRNHLSGDSLQLGLVSHCRQTYTDAAGLDRAQRFMRDDDPAAAIFRKAASATVGPFIAELQRVGRETMIQGPDGEIKSLATLVHEEALARKGADRGTGHTMDDGLKRLALQQVRAAFESKEESFEAMKMVLTDLARAAKNGLTYFLINHGGAVGGNSLLTTRMDEVASALILGHSAPAATAAQSEGASSFYSEFYTTFIIPGIRQKDPDIMAFLSELLGPDFNGPSTLLSGE